MASGANPEKEPITMQSITIGRFDKDPEAQGVIKPEDGRWQLVLDKDGYPHLYLQVKIAGGGGEEQTTGMLCLDDMLIEQMTSWTAASSAENSHRRKRRRRSRSTRRIAKSGRFPARADFLEPSCKMRGLGSLLSRDGIPTIRW